MDDNVGKARDALLALARIIENKEYPRRNREWGGADVAITSKAPEVAPAGFYPAPRTVITKYSRELSWLFERLRDVFSPFLDSTSKIEFYGRLANMAMRYQQRLKDQVEQETDLLLAILHEAFAILEEMEEGRFQFLSVAVGGTIFDDLVAEAESSGYLGIEETEIFFAQMERRYKDA